MDPWLARAIVLRERASLDHADVVLRHLLDLAERTRHIAFIVETQVQLSRLRFAQGRGGEALDSLAGARRPQAFAATPHHLLARIHALEGRYWVAAGDLSRARHLLSLLPDSVPAALLVARIAIAEHEPRRALDRLARIDPDRLHRASAIDLAMLAARACIPVDLREAERWMRKALDLGRPEHFLQSFVDEGEDVIRLLRRLAATDPSPYIRDVVAAGEHLVAAPPPSPPELFEPLSHRERAVLRLLPSQLSNQEIAGELHVSLNTLKTHLKSIYRKLEAGSRSQAVARARGLKVI
jgi:LuxR family transcriptional regulator, maltose regulon positive regulatory protein